MATREQERLARISEGACGVGALLTASLPSRGQRCDRNLLHAMFSITDQRGESDGGGTPTPSFQVHQPAPFSAPCVTVSLLFGASVEETLAGFTTVWMHGEHNGSTAEALSVAIRRASDIDDADVMVDFSDVSSIDMSVVGVIHSSAASLQRRSLSLRTRRPSACVSRLVETNGLDWLFREDPSRM